MAGFEPVTRKGTSSARMVQSKALTWPTMAVNSGVSAGGCFFTPTHRKSNTHTHTHTHTHTNACPRTEVTSQRDLFLKTDWLTALVQLEPGKNDQKTILGRQCLLYFSCLEYNNFSPFVELASSSFVQVDTGFVHFAFPSHQLFYANLILLTRFHLSKCELPKAMRIIEKLAKKKCKKKS